MSDEDHKRVMEEREVTTTASDNRNLALLVYILQTVALAVGVTAIAGVIVNYLKRDAMMGTWLESHFDWQIKTFWYALIGFVISYLLSFVLIGFVLMPLVGIWYIYRVVKGWLALNDGKPLSDDLI